MSKRKVNKEKEEEPVIVIPDDYFVEGIYIDLKKAFKNHEKLNRLRKKYGIKQV